MKRFNDNTGKQWEFSIVGATVRRVEGATGINLARLFFPVPGGVPTANELTDPVKQIEVLHALVDNPGKLSLDEFEARMLGEPWAPAVELFWAELADFFGQSGQPKMSAAALEVAKEVAASLSTAGDTSSNAAASSEPAATG